MLSPCVRSHPLVGCGRTKGRAAGAIAPPPCPTGQAAAPLTAPGKRVRVTGAKTGITDSAAIAAENPSGFFGVVFRAECDERSRILTTVVFLLP